MKTPDTQLDALIDAACATLSRDALSSERADALFETIQERAQSRPAASLEALPEILTMDEVADLLRVSPDELQAELPTLPVFEFAGRLRMRRSRLFEWIEAREKKTHARKLYSVGTP